MARTEKKLFRIADRLAELAEDERLVRAELTYHRSLHDDARRDAAVSGHYIDREEADLTAADVARFERALAEIQQRRSRLESTRRALLQRLGTG